MRNLITFIQQKILSYSTLCVFCGDYHQGPLALCSFCSQFLRPITHACSICKYPLVDSQFSFCGKCILKKPSFDAVITAYFFEDPLRKIIHDFKYHQALYLKKFLAKLLFDALRDQIYQSDCIIPVPIHPKRLKVRGFNQAAELAKIVANQLKIQYAPTICQKIINTTAQVKLNQRQRQSNLRGAFRVKDCPYQKVTLVDDLLTTGATANEIAFLLKEQGVKQVDILCCARAI